METKKNVAVLFGGKSPEHEVSVITGLQVVNNIDNEKFNVVPIYVSKKGEWFTSNEFNKADTFKNLERIPSISSTVEFVPQAESTFRIKKFLTFGNPQTIDIDVIFPCFHGALGENGGFQSLFELAEVAYVGSGILGSAISMDKVVMKDVFKAGGLPITNYDWFYRNDWIKNQENILKRLEDKLKYPMFVKPSNGGSSIGMAKAKNREQLINGIEVASVFDRKIVIEESYESKNELEKVKEINISVVGNSGSELETSVCEEVFASSDFLNYEDKYVGSSGGKGSYSSKGESSKSGVKSSAGMASTRRQLPADLKSETVEKIRAIAKKAFELLDCNGLARIDFLVKENLNEVKILEVNTIPGSMSFYLWEATKVPFKDLITKLIDLAMAKRKDTSINTTVFQSNILQTFGNSLKGPKSGKI